jgi:hypothetical protein
VTGGYSGLEEDEAAPSVQRSTVEPRPDRSVRAGPKRLVRADGVLMVGGVVPVLRFIVRRTHVDVCDQIQN